MRLEIQGHRGARALRPENTIPSFEAALDAGAGSIETDLQFSRDHGIVLFHDSFVRCEQCRVWWNDRKCDLRQVRRVSQLQTKTLQHVIAEGNPDPERFPQQRAERPPLSCWFAEHYFPAPHDPYTIPLLHHLFEFVRAYAGEAGERHGKSTAQRAAAALVILDLEIKNEPFAAPLAADAPRLAAAAIERSGMAARCRLRSFDHRIVRSVGEFLPDLQTAVLIGGTAPVDLARMVRDAGAAICCPEYRFLDEEQVNRLHDAGIRVIPWTVNAPDDWRRLMEWQVDGITTDDPGALVAFGDGRSP